MLPSSNDGTEQKADREGEEVWRGPGNTVGKSLKWDIILNIFGSLFSLELGSLHKHICFISDPETDSFFFKVLM